MILIYITIYATSRSVKFFKDNSNTIASLDKSHKKLLIINLLFILISLYIQFYLLLFYNNVIPLYITLISILSLLSYYFISIYSIIKTVNLELTQRDLEQSELHNKTLQVLYNNVSGFKHDFSNILTAFGGLISSKNKLVIAD